MAGVNARGRHVVSEGSGARAQLRPCKDSEFYLEGCGKLSRVLSKRVTDRF